jgi:hypothetical protein
VVRIPYSNFQCGGEATGLTPNVSKIAKDIPDRSQLLIPPPHTIHVIWMVPLWTVVDYSKQVPKCIHTKFQWRKRYPPRFQLSRAAGNGKRCTRSCTPSFWVLPSNNSKTPPLFGRPSGLPNCWTCFSNWRFACHHHHSRDNWPNFCAFSVPRLRGGRNLRDGKDLHRLAGHLGQDHLFSLIFMFKFTYNRNRN